ncbi:hypothetical protein Ae201684P_014958 [Aphanomyces euteiches]|nr:hypothetical protein Ae201684P_014958 [Aphanomyces euteiches]KAH9139352.1 hypothetical protein AeRB84_016375 [Aphanomyces euteiches]
MGHQASKEVECDLSLERLEELRMVTQLPIPDIQAIRRKFLTWSPQDDMTKDEFLAIPALAVNPLRCRLFNLMEVSPRSTVDFQEFLVLMAGLTFHASRDSKLRLSFKLQDMDGDGKVSKADLIAYIQLVADFGDLNPEVVEKNLDVIASRTLEEASSDPSGEFLSFDDFARVVLATEDFETKLLIGNM